MIVKHDEKIRTLLSWSSGKDSAWALHQLKSRPDIELIGLFTTVNQAFDRVAMHGVRTELLQQQAEAASLPLHIIEIPYPCSNEEYAARMSDFIKKAKTLRTDAFAFGDLFLEDIRQYRQEKLAQTGIKALFPLWNTPTRQLAHDMIKGGLKAKLTCIDPKKLHRDFAGKEFNQSLLNELPSNIDPCGENGEFHSFVYDGPMFNTPIKIITGNTEERDGFMFCDLLPERFNLGSAVDL